MLTARQIYLVTAEQLAKRDQPWMEEAWKRHERQGLLWRFVGLGSWTTEAILTRLFELGVDTGPESFPAEARAAGSTVVLEELWRRRAPEPEDSWDDFFFIAAEELWRRLAPDVPCPELVSDRLEAEIRAGHERQNRAHTPEETRSAMDAILVLVEYLETFPPRRRPEAFQDVHDAGIYHQELWIKEFLFNEGYRYPDESARAANVLAECFEEGQDDMAWVLARAGRRRQAEQVVATSIRRSPRDAMTRVRVGDIYAEVFDEFDTALAYFKEGLELAREPIEWDAAMQRMERLLGPDERAALARRFPRPRSVTERAPPPPPRAPPPPPRALPRAVTPLRKVGRNDPCPCGSGKKYKKCCLGRR